MLLFTNMKFSCKHGGDGVSTWTKFNGHICPIIMQKYYLYLLYHAVRFIVVSIILFTNI